MKPVQPKALTAALLGVAMLLSAGCGEFAYKRGAAASDLEQARQECRRQHDAPQEVDGCMQAKGWYVQKLDAPGLVFIEPGTPASSREESAEQASGARKPGDPAALPVTPSGSETVMVGSWWKAGGGPDGMKSALQECAAQGAPIPQAGPKGMNVTRSQLLCMRERGWHAMGAR